MKFTKGNSKFFKKFISRFFDWNPEFLQKGLVQGPPRTPQGGATDSEEFLRGLQKSIILQLCWLTWHKFIQIEVCGAPARHRRTHEGNHRAQCLQIIMVAYLFSSDAFQ